MAHPAQMAFVHNLRSRHARFFYKTRVLEVGSLDLNGSIRPFFFDCDYVGIDLGEGPGVDFVCSGHEYEDTKLFDVVCSTEMFEHNLHWRETWDRMVDLCRPGGLVFFTCAAPGREEHGTPTHKPWNSPFTTKRWGGYYENRQAEDFDVSEFAPAIFELNAQDHDLYFWGIKK